MATPPPIKTTIEDIDAVVAYVRTQLGWVSIDTMKKAIPPSKADNRKIEAMKYVGLLERDGANVKLTEAGRNYASAGPPERVTILRSCLRAVPLYNQTLEWIHFNSKESVSKPDVGNYWHDQHEDQLAGAAGAALGDAAIFFLRLAGAAELGKFVAAGVGRETHLQVDVAALAELVTGDPPPAPPQQQLEQQQQQTQPPPPPPPPAATVSPGLRVNVEIHIAADAKPATVEEIFKNMRKYLMDQPETTDGS